MAHRVYPQLRASRTRAWKIWTLIRQPRHWKGLANGLKYGVFPSLEHAAVPFGTQFRTVIDVGASRGQFALFAQSQFPGARIICFEPFPKAQRTAARILTGGGVEVHRVALGASSGVATLHVSARTDSSSVLPIGPGQRSVFPGTAETGQLTVPIARLEKYLKNDVRQPCLLKLDVQGTELDVLRGAGPKLNEITEILVEVSFIELYSGQTLAGDVIKYLIGNDFALIGVHGLYRTKDGRAVQADLLFRRKGAFTPR